MSADWHKQLLTTASHSRLQRHGQHQHRLVGNVFLPAIQTQTQMRSALSMKHLQVIEQCIIAENRREEQLAKCQTEKERRYMTKKFQAQRDHEHDLIQALMVGQPADAELEIVDIEATLNAQTSPLANRATASSTTGMEITISSPDKVISVGSSSKSPKKELKGSSCSPPRSVSARLSRLSSSTSPSSKTKNKTLPIPSSPDAKRGRSRFPDPSSKPKLTPVRGASGQKTPIQLPLANSPLLPASRVQTHLPTKSLTSPKLKKKVPPKHNTFALPLEQIDSVPDELDPIISFVGPENFLDARQHAMSVIQQRHGLVDGDTQTTERVADHHERYACHSDDDMIAVLTRETREEGESEVLALSTTGDSAWASPSKIKRTRRPQSSPEARRRPRIPISETGMTHSNSDSSLRAIEYFQDQQDSHIEGIKTFVSEQRDKRIHLLPKSNLSEVLRQELDWQVDKDLTSDTTCIMDAEEESEPKDGDQPLDAAPTDDITIEPPEEEEVVEEQPPLVGDESVDHTTDEDLLLETVASAVYDLVDMVIIHVEEEEREPVEAWIMPEKRRSTVMDLTRFIVRIQSTYRGHRARRAFRFALYQEALTCGVLGAMPGTFQGQSGWYQDPKTLMAYYFKIQSNGEWRQKIVLRCNSLILTPYQMHEEILSKVFVDS